MKIEILTLFPSMFEGFLNTSLIEKIASRKLLDISVVNIRNFSDEPHNRVDDTPYGGGPGMVLMAEPILRAVEDAKTRLPNAKVILFSPTGEVYSQPLARQLSTVDQLILICGRYEGVDQRAIDLVVDMQLSLGDYILMGGEVAAMAVIESIARLLPGALGNVTSAIDESFAENSNLLEAPQYTKPAAVRGLTVPKVLLSGDHQAISNWKSEQVQRLTEKHRPDLIKRNLPE